jgi:superfamily I DNA/RNA helicase
LVFLHPSQRKVVERRYNGPARVSGAAGTGKTVVAVHRAIELAKRNPAAKILITTFSKTLALRLSWQTKLLIGPESPLLSRIRIEHVHKVARDAGGDRGGGVHRAPRRALSRLALTPRRDGLAP